MTKLFDQSGTFYQVLEARNSNTSSLDPLVLIHGLGLTSSTWDGHLEALSNHHRVVSYDLLGHGQSVLPTRTPSLKLFAEQIRNLLDELAIEKATLVGFSLGGMINRRFAIDFPDRTAGLVILNSPHERGEEAQRQVEERALSSSEGGPAANIDATMKRWFTPTFRNEQPEMVQRVKDGVLANDPKTYAECRYVLANGVVELIRPAPPISHPALVMTCENDTGSTPKMSHAIASEIEGSETLIVPELRHMGLVEKPELFTNAILDFLERRLS